MRYISSMKNKLIIAIDGPAASGKGTLSRKIAESLNCAHMDTGALYRATALEVLNTNEDPANQVAATEAAQELADKVHAAASPQDILGNPALREDRVGNAASKVASIPSVRAALLKLQQDFAQNPGDTYDGAVLDGRDIGTIVCPNADVKLFVTANVEIRAQRRTKELQSKGLDVTYEAVLKDMRERDALDTARVAAPMKPAEDAVILDTSALDPEEMLKKALQFIADKRQN